MIHIEQVDLDSRNVVLPNSAVGMVIAQPFLALSNAEPYRCAPGQRDTQFATINRTLGIARAAPHGADKTHFTIFPEYSIPGLDGVVCIDNALQDDGWPTGTILIGGIDGLSKEEYAALAARDGTHYDAVRSNPDNVSTDEWVNCGVIWVKSRNQVERWLQPKIAPAVPEWDTSHQQMFPGRVVHLFRGSFRNGAPCLFFSLICFDWIAAEETRRIWECVLQAVNDVATNLHASLPMSWAFVIQHNERPCAESFLRGTADFFGTQPDFAQAPRQDACVVFANTAGKASPGRVTRYGFTSLIFSHRAPLAKPEKAHPTYTTQSKRLRATESLGPCIDVLFRESGACIHSFAQNLPGSIVINAGGRKPPIERPYVHPLPNAPIDPRTPSRSVPAAIKCLNDILDSIECLSERYGYAMLAPMVRAQHNANVSDLRNLNPEKSDRCVSQATASEQAIAQVRAKKTQDDWGLDEQFAVEHVVHSLDILGLCFTPIEIAASTAHATVTIRDETIDVIVVRGKSHEQCLKHSEDIVPPPRRKVLIVSRDQDNSPFLSRFGSILSPNPSKISEEPKYNDPNTAKFTIGYQDLLSAYLTIDNVEHLEESLYGKLTS